MNDWIVPDWPAPNVVRAVSTTRVGGCSSSPYESLNLGDHVGDEPARVRRNRKYLMQRLGLVSEPPWLQQVHGCEVVVCGQTGPAPQADAITAAAPGEVCAVLTADCLPVLLCDRSGKQVAAVHAGWRGLQAGVIESAVASFGESRDRILAWLGPAIGPEAFEVGSEVRDAFVRSHPRDEQAFSPGRNNRWMADIYQLARNRLKQCDVSFVGGGEYCTHSDPERFFSYRREGRTGRMASLIWIDNQQ